MDWGKVVKKVLTGGGVTLLAYVTTYIANNDVAVTSYIGTVLSGHAWLAAVVGGAVTGLANYWKHKDD